VEERKPHSEKEAATRHRAFYPSAKPELVVQIDAVKQMASKPSKSEVLLDVRPDNGLRGEGSHIPARSMCMDGG